MRYFFLLLCSFPLWLWSQPDQYHSNLLNELQQTYGLTGGTWMFPPNETTVSQQSTHYGCTRQNYGISGQAFSEVIQLTIPAGGANPWDSGLFLNSSETIQTGDRLLVMAWVRTTTAPGGMTLFAEDVNTFAKEIYLGIELKDTAWQQIFIPFEAEKAYASGEMNIGFHLAYQAQVLEIAGLNAINYGSSYALEDLPVLFPVRYNGDEPNAPWRTAAIQRIEQHRKVNLELTVQDGQGQPLANQPVHVKMLQHEFGFGTAVTPRRLAGNSWNDPTYAQHLTDLDGQGHGFNLAVTENALKWRAWEQFWAGTPAETMKGLEWLDEQGIEVRGHVLLWPGWTYMPSDMQTNSQDPFYLRNRMSSHLDDILNRPAVRQIVREWDAINEISHVRDLENSLAGQSGYPTGREIYPWFLQQIENEDPNLVHYLNDYEILSNGSVNGAAYLLFKQMVAEIINAGGKVDGIGFQGHMGTRLVAPDSLYAILEDCYLQFGLPIKITEYDLPKELPDELEAQYLRDFLTMIFSHPGVNGFLMWGFWDGAHWKDNAPLFYEDWSPKPALDTFVNLVFDQWWTDTVLTTDSQGIIDLRGFKGDYFIEATALGLGQKLILDQDTQATVQLFAVSITPPSEPIKLFPQPADQKLWVEFPSRLPRELTLFDPAGRKLRNWKTSENEFQINTGDLSSGLYFLQINRPGQRPEVLKVLISR